MAKKPQAPSPKVEQGEFSFKNGPVSRGGRVQGGLLGLMRECGKIRRRWYGIAMAYDRKINQQKEGPDESKEKKIDVPVSELRKDDRLSRDDVTHANPRSQHAPAKETA